MVGATGLTITHSETPRKWNWPSSMDSRNIFSSRLVESWYHVTFFLEFVTILQLYIYDNSLLGVKIIDVQPRDLTSMAPESAPTRETKSLTYTINSGSQHLFTSV